MKNLQRILTVLFLAASGCALAQGNPSNSSTGSGSYYGALRINSASYKAHDMDSSARPGLGQFVPGDDSRSAAGGSLALGYQLPSNWRVEAEYTLPKNNEFTSGSTNFPTSFNHHKIRSQRLMLNAYKDFPLNAQFSLYGMGGLGLSLLESSGWQGNVNRQYFSDSQNKLTYSLGLGLSYSPVQKVSIDLGWRYVAMGKTRSGANNFTNVRGKQDEQMRAKLTSSEVTLGLRYSF
ncbi:outer membrane protein [Comamonas odontotermitis]|uniref:outer membrane protein n=1 Tax=Comamonas odontotermitis TaxID=379895 RepID=UPI001CC66809|nr:outer membrane beta-barrel protein [Comamonas odontotermitis]UBB18063.1 outer membrane beta-barrel protein [Comamonas odontotermitis]